MGHTGAGGEGYVKTIQYNVEKWGEVPIAEGSHKQSQTSENGERGSREGKNEIGEQGCVKRKVVYKSIIE